VFVFLDHDVYLNEENNNIPIVCSTNEEENHIPNNYGSVYIIKEKNDSFGYAIKFRLYHNIYCLFF
jgi:hypothetical protein